MNVPLIQMPREVAREQLRVYRRSLHRRADAEYETVAAALEELSRGTRLVQLSDAFSRAERDAKGRPRLAIARADRKRVQYRSSQGNGWCDAFDCAYDHRFGRHPRNCIIDVRATPLTPRTHVHGYAILPIVPPLVRGTRDLTQHFTLWEVIEWKDNARDVGPDFDPYLLRHVVADTYAIVGEWEVSAAERLAVTGRRDR